MKKYSVLLFCMLGLLIFNSCEDDRSNNPRYTNPTAFVLNTPKYAEGFYDLKKTETIQLTCSQPDYGFAAAAVYSVQISTDNNFDPEKGYVEADQTLETTYALCKMDISAEEFDVAICKALKVVTAADMPTEAIPVYVRLKAAIPNVEGSVIYSNVITLNKVMPYYALPAVKLPTTMNMIGDFCGWDWAKAASLVPINGAPGYFWTIRYVKAGDGFKFNFNSAWDGNEFGFGKATVKTTVAGDVTDKEGNFTIAKGGWYIFAIKATIKGRGYDYTLEILPPNVYVYGPANGGTFGNMPEWKFEVIDDPDAEYPFVSPTVLATTGADDNSCLRLCIHPDEWEGENKIEWWGTEFIFFNNVITYRGTGGDQARVGSIAGKVYLNFVTGKAKCK